MTPPDHNCPLCRCAWTPQGVVPGVGFKTRNAEVAANFQAMATMIRELKAENKRLRRKGRTVAEDHPADLVTP